MLVDPPPDGERDPAVGGGRAHERDDLVVGGVEDGRAVHGDDLVAGEETPVDVGGAARNYVTDGNLKRRRIFSWLVIAIIQ